MLVHFFKIGSLSPWGDLYRNFVKEKWVLLHPREIRRSSRRSNISICDFENDISQKMALRHIPYPFLRFTRYNLIERRFSRLNFASVRTQCTCFACGRTRVWFPLLSKNVHECVSSLFIQKHPSRAISGITPNLNHEYIIKRKYCFEKNDQLRKEERTKEQVWT